MFKYPRYEQSLLEERYSGEGLFSPVKGLSLLGKRAANTSNLTNLSIMTDQTPPLCVREAASKQALSGGYIKNSLELREKIADYYLDSRLATFDAKSEIFITPGSQFAMDAAFKLLINPGDEVIIGSPEYATYEPMISFYGGKPRVIPLGFDGSRWCFDKDAFSRAITSETKLVVISNPNNPSGFVYRKEDIEHIVLEVKNKGCWLVSDEIWSMYLLDQNTKYTSFSSYEEIKDQTITLFSASKTFGMSGYRTGAVLGPSDFIVAVDQVNRYAAQAAPTIGQIALIEALNFEKTGSWLKSRIEEIRQRAQDIVESMNHFSKLRCTVPESGVFLFPDIGDYGMTSLDFSLNLLESKGVFVLPGYFYGLKADRFIRISLSVPEEDFRKGFGLFFDFISELESCQK